MTSSFCEKDDFVIVQDDRGVSDIESSSDSSDDSTEKVPKKMQIYSPIGSSTDRI
jgi:hypothetical protein